MTKKGKFGLVYTLLLLLLVSGCVKQQECIVKNANELKTLYIQVPKYSLSTVYTYWKLGLHPKDVVLGVRVVIPDFHDSQSAEFSYDKNYAVLNVKFRMGPPFTISPGSIEMRLEIRFLQYYELRSHGHKKSVYYVAKITRKLVASPEYPDVDEGITIPSRLNKWNIEKWKYEQLYRELASLGPSEKKNLRESLNKEVIARVTSEDLKAYLRTARFILSRL